MWAGGAVAVALVAGVVAWQLSGSDDPAILAGAGGSYHLVQIDTSGPAGETVTVSATDGSNPVTYELPEGFSPIVGGGLGSWLIDTEGATLRALDLRTGEITSVALPSDDLMVSDASVVPGSDEVVLFSPLGEAPPVVVDLAAETVDPLMDDAGVFPLDVRNGVQLFVSSGSSEFSTLVVPSGAPSTAWRVPGGVLDLRDTDALVVSFGDEVTIGRYAGASASGPAITVAVRPAGGLLIGDRALVVDTAGALAELDLVAGTSQSRGVVGFAVDGAVAVGDDRLLAFGDDGSVLFSAEGDVVASFQPRPGSSGVEEGVVPVLIGSRCMALQPGRRPLMQDAGAELIEVATGKVLSQLDATPRALADDGCSVLTMGNPGELVIDGEPIDVEGGVMAVRPDLRSVVVIAGDADRTLTLLDLTTGASTPLSQGFYRFATF